MRFYLKPLFYYKMSIQNELLLNPTPKDNDIEKSKNHNSVNKNDKRHGISRTSTREKDNKLMNKLR